MKYGFPIQYSICLSSIIVSSSSKSTSKGTSSDPWLMVTSLVSTYVSVSSCQGYRNVSWHADLVESRNLRLSHTNNQHKHMSSVIRIQTFARVGMWQNCKILRNKRRERVPNLLHLLTTNIVVMRFWTCHFTFVLWQNGTNVGFLCFFPSTQVQCLLIVWSLRCFYGQKNANIGFTLLPSLILKQKLVFCMVYNVFK